MDPVLTAIDQVRLNVNPTGMNIINAAIGLLMLGVALELKLQNFKRILVAPKAPVLGLVAQFILLPALTFCLVWLIRPQPSVALGMMLVAACPGGNLSNIVTYLAKGNSAVSISMTAISTLAAIAMTPLNISFWGSLNPDTAIILQKVSLNPVAVFKTVFFILGIPLVVGMALGHWFPGLAHRVRTPFKLFSLMFFLVIVMGALAANWTYFLDYVGGVVFAVFLHNAMALNIGYWSGRAARLEEGDCRALCIEVGIQNSALGLVLVFNFFDGLGGMAIVTAWWAIWHIVAGLVAALFFNLKKKVLPARGIQVRNGE